MFPWSRGLLEKLIFTSQEICCLLRNQNIHYHAYESPPLGSLLNHMDLVHTLLLYIHFNIVLSLTAK
jgi:hypothetical protein